MEVAQYKNNYRTYQKLQLQITVFLSTFILQTEVKTCISTRGSSPKKSFCGGDM